MAVIVLLRLINLMFTLYSFAFIARMFLPLLRIDHYHPVARFLFQITEPLLSLLRRYIPTRGVVDFTPMVAVFILWLVQWLLQTLVWMFLS